MAFLVEKQRSKRFGRTGRREDDDPIVMRAESIGLPEGFIDRGDGVHERLTICPGMEIYETWTVRPLPVVH